MTQPLSSPILQSMREKAYLECLFINSLVLEIPIILQKSRQVVVWIFLTHSIKRYVVSKEIDYVRPQLKVFMPIGRIDYIWLVLNHWGHHEVSHQNVRFVNFNGLRHSNKLTCVVTHIIQLLFLPCSLFTTPLMECSFYLRIELTNIKKFWTAHALSQSLHTHKLK